MQYINKRLIIEKIKVEDIAKKFGTPTYCYSYKKLKENINNFKNNFKSFSPLICFAIKSNTNVNLIIEIR
ncbi:diaminopimelate decarboxylase, partial [Candidatus Pelagibacter sp.]|nr:diaminopimelate decarboxylase [Candidatus Pelagibacter sp.]